MNRQQSTQPRSEKGEETPRPNQGFRYYFDAFSSLVARRAGSPWVFSLALVLVIIWAVCGPIFGFSAVWQLVINTGTTIVTFLMVFLIQHSQNKDSQAVHLKLDELLRAVTDADGDLIAADRLDDHQLKRLRRADDLSCRSGDGGTR